MASYRPKSLDELNNLYDRAVSAEQAIKKGTSLLGEDALGAPQDEPQEKKASFAPPAESKVESVSPDIDAFIKQFSSDDGRPVPLSRLTPSAPAQPESRPEKQEGITGLMDDYANVMTGAYDDEDDEPKKNRFRQRRGKRKASKEILSDSFEPQDEPQNAEYSRTQAPPVSPSPDEVGLHEGASLFENDDVSYTPTYENTSPQGEIPDGADDEQGDVLYEREDDGQDDFSFGEIAPAPSLSGGKRAAKVLLILLLVLTLIATAATGACVLTVDSGRELGSVSLYTVEKADVKTGISADDLVVCKGAEEFQKYQNVVYYDTDGKRTVGKIIIVNGNDTYNIDISDVQKDRILGVAEKGVSSLGKIAKAVSNAFLVILIALVAVAIAITLTLCFAFKPKQNVKKKKRTAHEQSGEQTGGEEPEHDADELFSGIE